MGGVGVIVLDTHMDMLSEDDPDFAEELARRVAAYERGESEATEWEIVRERIREELKKARQS